jgi:tRNA nucleotidyltransferase/poly(A) polymerase
MGVLNSLDEDFQVATSPTIADNYVAVTVVYQSLPIYHIRFVGRAFGTILVEFNHSNYSAINAERLEEIHCP